MIGLRDIELENLVLGAVLVDSSAFMVIESFFSVELFSDPVNRLIAKSIITLKTDNQPVDIVTVVKQLKRSNDLESAGGPTVVTKLTQRIGSSANIEAHGRLLMEAWMRRKMNDSANTLLRKSCDQTVDTFDMLDEFSRTLTDLSSKIYADQVSDARELFGLFKEKNAKIIEKKGEISGIPSGFSELDHNTGGWQNGDLIILAARPGMGKTAFCLQLARNPAAEFNIPVAIFSLEMSRLALFNRLLAQETSITLRKIKYNGINDGELSDLHVHAHKLISAPIYVDDKPNITLFELRAKARRLKEKHGVKMLIVDYLQIMGGPENSTIERVTNISKGLKAIAKELDMPVIALSQLSRSLETRGGDKIPQLSDLRDSGAIEQDADIVMFIYRPEYYGIESDEAGNSTVGKAMVIIEKFRDGKPCEVPLYWEGHFTRFVDPKISSQFPVEEKFSALTPNENFNETPF